MRRRILMGRGFTLVEILCVVAILGIAAAVIVPQVGTRNDLQAAAAARVVMADLIYAQNRAISTQSMTYVAFNVAGESYSLYSSMSPQTYVQHPVNLTNYVTTLGAGSLQNCSLGSASFAGQNTLAFDELGTPYSFNTSTSTATPLSGNGTITVTCGTFTLTITVEQDTGEMTVQ